jgi:hypothetical protein
MDSNFIKIRHHSVVKFWWGNTKERERERERNIFEISVVPHLQNKILICYTKSQTYNPTVTKITRKFNTKD